MISRELHDITTGSPDFSMFLDYSHICCVIRYGTVLTTFHVKSSSILLIEPAYLQLHLGNFSRNSMVLLQQYCIEK